MLDLQLWPGGPSPPDTSLTCVRSATTTTSSSPSSSRVVCSEAAPSWGAATTSAAPNLHMFTLTRRHQEMQPCTAAMSMGT